MSDHRKQSCFLKRLLDFDQSAGAQELQERLQVAERNEDCLFSACRLVIIVGMLGVSGLAYSAVLHPGFFDNSSHFLIQICGAVGLGSLLCLIIFSGLWLGYRSVANRVREECRQAIFTVLEARLHPDIHRDEPVIRNAPIVAVFHDRTASLSAASEIVSLPKAS